MQKCLLTFEEEGLFSLKNHHVPLCLRFCISRSVQQKRTALHLRHADEPFQHLSGGQLLHTTSTGPMKRVRALLASAAYLSTPRRITAA